MYRRKRKFRGTWFPCFGTEPDTNQLWTGLNDTVILPNDDGIKTQLIAVLPDQPVEDFDDADKSLADSIGSEYALRRIVGKFFAAPSSSSGNPNSQTIKVALGFFVARVDPVNPDIPIGAAGDFTGSVAEESTFDSYSPLALSATRQPWIWRRTWLLSSVNASDLTPRSTAQYGSVLDGGHVDAKTRRRVKMDERLFAAISFAWFPYTVPTDPGVGSMSITYDLDVRYFGALRKARAKGAF